MNPSGARQPPPGVVIQRVPTLTEVIESELPLDAAAAQAWPASAVDGAVPAPPPSEADITDRILADVQRQVELMLEHRLREALMPALLQATDALVLQARTELASTLREVVSRAVAHELARHR